MTNTEQQIQDLENKISRLQRRIEALESAQTESDPWWRNARPGVSVPAPGKNWAASCPVCGIDLSKATGYCCNRSDCPSAVTC